MDFQISVIIPVFNAEQLIEKAVTSANLQPEVGEIIVVDDGSTDETPKILQRLSKKMNFLRVVNHPSGVNKGRSASRNLGIRSATKDYIAFLDADDYYLKGRFQNDAKIFKKNPHIDGVYNAIGAHFYRLPKDGEEERYGLTTIKYSIPPERLFYEMAPMGRSGYFSGDGLTVKKSIFDKTGYFNEDLEVAEDAHLWIKMSLCANLIGGILESPVSMRGVHENNVFQLYGTEMYNKNMAKMYNSLLGWAYAKGFGNEVISFFWDQIHIYNRYLNLRSTQGMKFKNWISYGAKYPRLLLIPNYLNSSPVLRAFKKVKSKFL